MSTIALSSAPKLPAMAQCRSLLADGRLLTITATRRPRANRADVKCALAGAPAICERMQQVVRLARHTETRFDSRDQVVLSMDHIPAADERDWELAAVLADRMVRGIYQPARPHVLAQGWSDGWHLGRVDGSAALAIEQVRHHLLDEPELILGGTGTGPGIAEFDGVANSEHNGETNGAATAHGQGAGSWSALRLLHLGALSGHPDPAASVSSATAWFPLHSGGVNDSLCWVEVSVRPVGQGGADEEDTIAVPGLDLAGQLAVRRALTGARHFDGRGLGRWRTVVRFAESRFQGASYELALVLADRLARGRECVPRGRVIASGCSSAWHAGRVETVDGREAKTALILQRAGRGDRVLLPAAWQAGLPDGFAAGLRARGASLACIEQIGMI